MMRRWTSAVVAVASTMSAGATMPAGAASERMSIPSFTPTSLAALVRHEAPARTVVGDFSPALGSGPQPALVLKPGSGGLVGPPGDSVRKWAALFNTWGISTLIVDSFGPRGISETATDQSQLSSWADVADALAALRVLGSDPRIDRMRIGIVGWSRGGSVAMNTALEVVRGSVIGDDLRFALHVVFYGGAAFQYRDRRTDQSPFLFFHGESDNFVGLGPTREFAAWAQTMGNAVTFVSYPRAHHDFDVEGGFNGFAKGVEAFTQCDFVMNVVNGHVIRMNHQADPTVTQDQIRAYARTCATRGATVAPNAAARADAVDKLHAFLRQYFHIA